MIEILDTTLRDGEQTAGVSYSSQEKVSLANLLLEDLGVNRIEIASARVSELEFESARRITKLAKDFGRLHQVEILGFIDNGKSARWIDEAGGKIMNLLAKGSYKHVTEQLRKTPEQHIEDIIHEIDLAKSHGLRVNLYLEDWSNGIINSPEYVYILIDKLKNTAIERFMLSDTLGILNPHSTWRSCRKMLNRYPNVSFDFHAHNDYDLAVANTMVAAEVGVKGVHVTMNGLGERAGNASLASVVAVFHDQLNFSTTIKEENINKVSRVAETYSGISISANQPIVGNNVFTQCAGIHADGDNKNHLYYNALNPERFGRIREYALGKLSGKSNIKKNLELLGIELNEAEMKLVTDRVIELGGKKEIITQEELPYIMTDVLKHDQKESMIKILSFAFVLTNGLRPTATVKIEIDGQEYEQTAAGEGQYHAFSKALWKIYTKLNKAKPTLINYAVFIPPGGQTNALVQTIITWKYKGKEFKTKALDADQIEAAVKATEKMLNLLEEM